MFNNKKTKTLLSTVIMIIALVLGVPIYNVTQNSSPKTEQTSDTSDPYWGESAESLSEELIPAESEAVDGDNSEESTIAESQAAAESTESAGTETAGETETEIESETETESVAENYTDAGLTVDEDGEYMSKEEVALYLYSYGHLPSNYITKKEAQDLGWVSSKGNLHKVAPGMSIGGDRFGNREGLLPDKKGRKYYECDIDYTSGTRNAKRIIFSNDGLIYYTEDHYNSFELLYGEE